MKASAEKTPKTSYSIRFQDCDPMGHLNNSRYIDYILNAREDHLENFYDMRLKDFISRGNGWVVTNHEIFYLKPAVYNEKVKIQTSLIEYGNDYVVVEGIILDEAETHCKALVWTRYTYVSVNTGKKVDHQPDLQDFFGLIRNEGVKVEEGIKNRLNKLYERTKSGLIMHNI
jgi:YbgC/YbaW family acyl-CoA thioester hydrolase